MKEHNTRKFAERILGKILNTFDLGLEMILIHQSIWLSVVRASKAISLTNLKVLLSCLTALS